MKQYKDFFIEDYNLPKHLTNEEIIQLFIDKKNGDPKARDKIVLHNIRFVLSIVCKNYYKSGYDLEDLCAIGLCALGNAVDKFEYTGKAVFATYLDKCVKNEINRFLKRNKNKIKPQNSIYDIIKVKSEIKGKVVEKAIIDTLYDDESIEDELERKEVARIVREEVEKVPEREREFIKLAFGFYDKEYTNKEIGKMYGIGGATVSKMIYKSLEQIKQGLIERGIDESTNDLPVSNRKKKLQTIYEDFNEYTKEEIDYVISQFSEDDMEILRARYGEDFNEMSISNLNYAQSGRFYSHTRPKIKRRLLALRKENENK